MKLNDLTLNCIRTMTMSLNGTAVKGVLLDITGVLAESSSEGDGQAVQGSVQAVQKLRDQGEDLDSQEI